MIAPFCAEWYIDLDVGLRPIAGGTGAETIAVIAGAAAVAGAGVAAYGSYQQGQAQAAAGKYNERVAANQAQAAREAAALEADRAHDKNRRLLASQRARIGASGITTEGSPLLVMMDSAEQAALDEATIRYRGSLGAAAATSEGVLQGFYGRQARRAGTIGAGASLLTGVSRAGASYASGQRTTTAPVTDYGGEGGSR